MRNLSVFQVIVLLVFGLFILVGFVLSALYSRQSQVGGSNLIFVTVWGTIPQSQARPFFDSIQSDELNLRVSYTQKDKDNYELEIVEAIAAGQSPDVIIINQGDFLENMNRIFPIPYNVYPAREFKDSFIEEAEIFTTPKGIYALPLSIDPMVMYWNRDMLSSASISVPPRYWDEMYYYAERIAKKDAAGNIDTAALALGSYQNINHAKNILSAMFLQKGVEPVTWSDNYSRFIADLGESNSVLDGAINFYTEFSNVTKSVYTWNRSLPDSKDMFISGKLAIYFGPASEMMEIKNKNPNLNFDVAVFPQLKNSSVRVTHGDVYGLAILKSSKRINTAIQALRLITSAESIKLWTESSYLSPVRTDVAVNKADPYLTVFRDSATISKGWLDPDSEKSDVIFEEMINSINSGRSTVNDARSSATNKLRALLPKI
jgi:ABC-type glycerol-3-phosphate transport system substrate-binding protein